MPNTVSIRNAYLFSLRSHLLQNAGAEYSSLPDSEYDRIFNSTSMGELVNAAASAQVPDKVKFLDSLNAFTMQRGHLPKESDLVPPALKIEISQDGFDKLDPFTDTLKATATNLSRVWKGVDFRPVLDLATEINPNFDSSIAKEDLASIDTENWRVFSNDLLMQVLLPTSNGLFINLMQGDEPYIFDFRINRRSWNLDTSLLDHAIWISDATLQDQRIAINSQTYKNYVLVDKSKCVDEGMNCFFNLVVLPRTKAHAVLKESNINLSLYSLLFSYKRVMKRQAAFARDMVKIQVWADENKHLAYGMSQDDKYKTVILSESSPVRSKINEISRPEIASLIISNFSSSLQGIVSEMEELIKSGKSEFATLAFLDFYGICELSDPKHASNINNVCSIYSLKFIQEQIDNKNPKLISEINVKNLSEKAPAVLALLNEIRDKNLN